MMDNIILLKLNCLQNVNMVLSVWNKFFEVGPICTNMCQACNDTVIPAFFTIPRTSEPSIIQCTRTSSDLHLAQLQPLHIKSISVLFSLIWDSSNSSNYYHQ